MANPAERIEAPDEPLPVVQARYLRALAGRVERGQTTERDERVLDAIEDELDRARIDVTEADRGSAVPYEQVRQELGLP
jgi:hypothetical protein